MEPDSHPRRTLSELIPPDAFVGAGLILRHQGRFLFGVRPLRWDGSRPVAEITAVGGRIEAEDASLSAAVQREALEEIGCQVRLQACQKTCVLHGPGQYEFVSITGAEQPAAIVFRFYKAPAHTPWNVPGPEHPAYRPPSCIVLFLADLHENPHASEELPALIWLTPQEILATARKDFPFGELTAGGTPVRYLQPDYPQPGYWARLTDSQEALALGLQEEALSFYQCLLEPGTAQAV